MNSSALLPHFWTALAIEAAIHNQADTNHLSASVESLPASKSMKLVKMALREKAIPPKELFGVQCNP